jgi:hypothetical protein
MLDGKRHEDNTCLENVALAVRNPQMVRAIAMSWRRDTAAELRRDLVHLAERPTAAAIVEFPDRARIRRQALGGCIGAGLNRRSCGGRPRRGGALI